MSRLNVVLGTAFIFFLLLITILVSNKKTYITDQSKVILYENFNNKLKDFDRIVFHNNVNKYEIVKDKGRWLIPNYYYYPVDLNKINIFLLEVAELNLIEKKTNNPNHHSRMGVSNKLNENIDSKRVEIYSKNRKLYDFFIGVRGKNQLTKDTRYIRKADQNQVWLFTDSLNIYQDYISWTNTSLLKLARWRIKRFNSLDTKNRDNSFSITRKSYDSQMYELISIPSNYTLSNTYVTNSVVSTLEGFQIKDIRKASDLKELKPLKILEIVTFDGLEMSIRIFNYENDKYIRINLSSNINEREELKKDGPKVVGIPNMKKFSEVEEEVKYNSFLSEWAFKLDQESINNLLYNKMNMLKEKETEDN